MLRAAIILIVLATILATYFVDSFIAPPIGAALLFVVLLAGWLYNRGDSRANRQRSEEATRRQREERARDER
ncbi:hypothetical protein [Erythrobacter donghaensis]|jgi:ABC-type transport system involved in cytochrome bd biosynthesis fused ATPase/permease subunit|uniref:hypothetical protein n=1 Tax=Erythrobacter donghaensis TaxID=267135 RepID=UPI00093B59E5|nr:hypothetical protein [Erythrobacter donghaensis]